MADIARSGWYGFPLHPMEKVFKIARHSNGVRINARDPERVVSGADEAQLRAFLDLAFPSIAKAPIVYRRLCLYCDTRDGDFWIDNHPDHRGLSVASGGSGHGFKFAPILGELIADSIENIPNRWLPKFAWRDLAGNTIGKEASRYHAS
jgi:glycine/D-amino acid oxidase-like deaminating enzyme